MPFALPSVGYSAGGYALGWTPFTKTSTSELNSDNDDVVSMAMDAHTRALLQRAAIARHAIKHYGLDPHLGLAWTLWPELFLQVPKVKEKAA